MGGDKLGLATLALVLLLLHGVCPLASGQGPEPPRITVDVPGQVLTHEPVKVRLGGQGIAGDEIVLNGDFDDRLGSWTPSTREVGEAGHVGAAAGVLNLTSDHATAPGAVFVVQRAALPAATSYALSYRVRQTSLASADVQVYVQTTGPDGRPVGQKLFAHAASRTWQTFDWTWNAGASGGQLTFQLRLLASQGALQSVEFDDASLRPVPRLDWSADAGVVQQAAGLAATVSFPTPGAHTVEAVAHLDGGQEATAAATIDVAAPAPSLQVVAESVDPTLEDPIQAHVAALEDPMATLRLRDPSFADVGGAWVLTGTDALAGPVVRGAGTPASGSGLELDADGASRNATVFVTQTIPLDGPAVATRFAVLVTSSDAVARYRMVVREIAANGTSRDTPVALFPAGSGEQELDLDWTPATTDLAGVRLFIGFEVRPGGAIRLGARDPVALQGNLSWTMDAQPLPGTGLSVQAAATRAGTHQLQATLRHGAAMVASATNAVVVHNVTVALGDIIPDVAVQVPGLPLRVDPSAADAPASHLRNGDLRHGTRDWTFVDSGVGGPANMTVQPGDPPALRLAADATQRGAIHASQAADPICPAVSCRLSLEYRSSGAAHPVVLAVSTANGSSAESRDVLSASAGWAHAVLDVPAWPGASSIIYLRATFDAGSAGWVEFRNVTLRPHASIARAGGGPATADGDLGLVVPVQPGPFELALEVTDAWNSTTIHREPVDVLPLALLRTTAGRWAFRSPVGSAGRPALWSPTANRTWTLGSATDLRRFTSEGQQYVLVPDEPGLILDLGNGSTTALAALQSFVAPPASEPQEQTLFVGAHTRLRLQVPGDDATIQLVTALVQVGQEPERPVAMSRSGGQWTAAVDLQSQLGGRPLSVRFLLDDGWGGQTSLVRHATVDGNPMLAIGLPTIVLAVGFAAMALVRRRLGGGAP